MRLPRSSATEPPFRPALDTERLKNRLFVGRILITRDQSRRLVIQASRRILYQLLRVLDRPLAIDDIQHEFVFGIQRDMIPVVAATSISRIVFVAIPFFLQSPIFVELNLFRLWGKKRRVRRVTVRHVDRQAGYDE